MMKAVSKIVALNQWPSYVDFPLWNAGHDLIPLFVITHKYSYTRVYTRQKALIV